MNLSKIVYILFLPAILLPVAVVLLVIFGRLFLGLENPHAAAVLHWTAFGLGLLWLVDLVALVLLLALRTIVDHSDD